MKTRIVTLAALLLGIMVSVNAQEGRASREILQRAGASVGGRDVVTAMHVYRGGVSEAQHVHPGDLVGYVVEGTVTLAQDGKASVRLTAGQVFFVASGVGHHVTSDGNARILATYIVEKDKPLAVAAP